MTAQRLTEEIPLFQLQDGRAPYKGIWSFTQSLAGVVEATHCTYFQDKGPACVIENRHFDASEDASRFVDHLVIHGWGIHELKPEGERLL